MLPPMYGIPSFTKVPHRAIVSCYDLQKHQDIFPLPNGSLNSSLHNKVKFCFLIPCGFSAITVKSLCISKKVIILNHNDHLLSKVIEDKEMKDAKNSTIQLMLEYIHRTEKAFDSHTLSFQGN